MVKNTFKMLLIIILLIWIPTGLPDDFIIIPYIINKIGFELYALFTIILIYMLYTTIEGRTIKDKLTNIKTEFKSLIK